MHEDCYFCIKRDICTKDVPKPCKYRYTEDERRADQASDMFGAILHKTYLHPTFRKKKEDNEMNSTSTQVIKNVKDISVTVENYPIEMESKLTIVASTDDDIFAFEFEGPNLMDACRKTGLFTGWEKDQEIREKNKEINKLKQQLQEIKEDSEYNVVLHGMEYTPDELVDRILELEKLKTPTIENFADEEPAADNVNHPSHYTGRYECIDVMQDVFGNGAVDNFCLCNAFKYIWRARKKNGLEDVKKAVWYLNKYIEEAEKDGVSKGKQI